MHFGRIPYRIFFLFGLFILLSRVALGTPTEVQAKNGVLDLRNQKITGNLALDGEWLFCWQELISNDLEFQDKPFIKVWVPTLWSKYKVNGQRLPSYGYATYKLSILLPKDHERYSLSIPKFFNSYRLFINNKLVSRIGKVGKTASETIPQWMNKQVDIPAGIDTVNLLFQTSNFVHYKAGIRNSIYLGPKEYVQIDRNRTEALDLLLTGWLMMGGLFFLGLYLFGNRDKAILAFALFAMVFSYRIIASGNSVLSNIFPNMDWYLALRMEYVSLVASIGLFALYNRFLYPKDINKNIVNIIGSVCTLYGLISLIFPPSVFTRLLNPFLFLSACCLIYVPYLYIRIFRKKRPGSFYALVSGLSLVIVFIISLLHYWRIIPPLQGITFTGLLIFFFLQSLFLSHRISYVIKLAGEQAAQGLNAKAEFLSTMSHEIRTPLNSVIGMSHLMLKNDPRADQKEHLDVIIFSANNLLNIVNDILDYSKIEAGKIVFEEIEMDVPGLAKNLVTSLHGAASDKGISLNLEVDPNLNYKVIGDPTRMFQVITNLVHNAIKFTSAGEVKLKINITGQDETNVTILCEIIDTGIGISEEKQAMIFERFTQADSSTSRSFGGTGLGLAITKRILELKGSKLQLKSAIGKGANFFFYLNLKRTNQPLKQKIISPLHILEEKPFSGLRILLVEDNPMNVLVAESFLKRWGAMVDVAVNGENALTVVDETVHKLVLMDLHMPVMDGYTSALTMRKSGIKIPIVALTATLPSEVEEKLAETGIDDIMVKPFLPDELYRKVYHHIFKEL